jgi:hypothetical protein
MTPLHRAVRDRCSAAVAALLRAAPIPGSGTTTAPARPTWRAGRPGAAAPAPR